jgi:hypothetical protein
VGVLKSILRVGRAEATPPEAEADWVREVLEEGAPALKSLRLVFRDWDTESVDGEVLNGAGFVLRDQDDLAVSYDDSRLGQQGLLITKVAGISYRAEAAQDPAFAAGKALAVVRDAGNPHDPNAVAIWDGGRRKHVGFVPRELARAVALRLDAGEELSAVSLWEWQKRGERVGVKILVGPVARVRHLLESNE